MSQDPEKSVPIVEERAVFDKQRVEAGRVRVRTVTERHDTTASGDLEGHAIDVERVPIGREIDAVPEITTEGDVTIMPVVEEILVVEKRLVLKEEVRIRHRRTHEAVEVPVTLRRQQALVERLPPEAEDGLGVPTEKD